MKKAILFFSLSSLFFFLFMTKYFSSLAVAIGWPNPITILVPLGISFYTFQAVGYLIDVSRKKIEGKTSLPDVALYLSFFPHILAGPIEPAQSFLPQVDNKSLFNRTNLQVGIFFIVVGLFKKLVIADRLEPIVKFIIEFPYGHSGSDIGLALVLARYQIYCDFSGYTDIALGSAQILGFKLTQNFNQPFFASSIGEFWRRWHISLGNWIKNYIFYPLVTTRFSVLGTSGIVLITFLILGIWHGGTVNYLMYGFWHGSFVLLDIGTKNFRNSIYKKIGATNYPRLLKAAGICGTFFLIVVPPTVFFVSPDFATAKILLRQIFSSWNLLEVQFLNRPGFKSSLIIASVSIIAMEVSHWLIKKYSANVEFLKFKWWTILAIVILVWMIAALGTFSGNSTFIYTRF